MDNDAITAGVRLGGLNDRTQIKILLCYLLATLDRPITQDQLNARVCGQELVNYFEMQTALGQLVEQGLIEYGEEGFSILPRGKEVASQLEGDVPDRIKKYAYNMALALVQYDALKKQNKVEIIPAPDKGYTLRCKLEDENFSIFSMDIHMPDKKIAELAARQFVLHGREIFNCILGIVINSPELYTDFLKELSSPKKKDDDTLLPKSDFYN